MHLDLNAFFAAVEEKNNPLIKGKPVIVGADPKKGAGRGVVSTCNYEARKFGVRSAMPISKAYSLCPQGVFVPVNYELYTETSLRVMDILRANVPKVEQVSIDEAYLEVSHTGSFDAAKELAKKLKQEILAKEGLLCSVGVGANKFVAKAASDFQKPDGLTVVLPENAVAFLAPQSVDVLRGVGPKTKEILEKMNLRTVKDVQNCAESELVKLLGDFGKSLHWQAQGYGPTEFVENWQVKSVGRQRTFEHDTNDRKKIFSLLDTMIDSVSQQLSSEKLSYKTVTVKVRYEDFETKTKQRNLIDYVDGPDAIQNLSRDLIAPFLNSTKKIRLVGVSVHNLKAAV